MAVNDRHGGGGTGRQDRQAGRTGQAEGDGRVVFLCSGWLVDGAGGGRDCHGLPVCLPSRVRQAGRCLWATASEARCRGDRECCRERAAEVLFWGMAIRRFCVRTVFNSKTRLWWLIRRRRWSSCSLRVSAARDEPPPPRDFAPWRGGGGNLAQTLHGESPTTVFLFWSPGVCLFTNELSTTHGNSASPPLAPPAVQTSANRAKIRKLSIPKTTNFHHQSPMQGCKCN